MRITKVLSLSLPPDLLRDAERIAKKERRTRSELFREALRRYIEERRWRQLQHYGIRQAQRRGIADTDLELLIGEYRKTR